MLFLKKISWYKPIEHHPVIYKDYILNYGTVVFQRIININTVLSYEESIQMLEDLNRACEIVESGNYSLE